MDDLPALITVTDLTGRCILVNRRQANPADGSPETPPGHDIARLLGTEPVGLSRLKDQEVLATGQAVAPFQEAPHGLPRMLTAKAPLRDANGAVVGVVSISLAMPSPASLAASEDDP
jgi:hypothetical protein